MIKIKMKIRKMVKNTDNDQNDDGDDDGTVIIDSGYGALIIIYDCDGAVANEDDNYI
jgi:hypothetical protein